VAIEPAASAVSLELLNITTEYSGGAAIGQRLYK
jgi:hypothetical protein